MRGVIYSPDSKLDLSATLDRVLLNLFFEFRSHCGCAFMAELREPFFFCELS